MTEDLTPQPEDPYGVAKYAVELDLRAAHEMFGLEYTIFRPHNVYGEHQNIGDRYRNVVGIFMNQLMQGEPMTIFGDGFADARVLATSTTLRRSSPAVVDVRRARRGVQRRRRPAVPPSASSPRSSPRRSGSSPRSEHLAARNEVIARVRVAREGAAVFGERQPVTLEDRRRPYGRLGQGEGPQPTPQFEGVEVRRNFPPAWRSQAVVDGA